MKFQILFAVFLAGSSSASIPADSCGLNKYNSNGSTMVPYIVGGTDSLPGEFPYQVSLQQLHHVCGGSIINKRWILSAAHCFPSRDPTMWKVVAGTHTLLALPPEPSQTVYKVSRIFKHEDYSELASNRNDIALMKLAKDIEFNDHIQPVCLADEKYPNLEAKGVIATGWGDTSEGGSHAKVLQKVALPVITNELCVEAYRTEKIYPTSLCAGDLTAGGIDACKGDSGGPLVHVNENGSFVQVGITSWGYGCAQPGRPGVYTRVSTMYEWIWATIKQYS